MNEEFIKACEPVNHWTVILSGIGLLHLVFEYWLGKTKKIKSNSTMELVLTAITAVSTAVIYFLRKKK